MKLPKPISNGVRVFNKYVTNRIARLAAGYSRTPFALVRHTGRRSGKAYETPIIVVPGSDGFIVALTYGPDVDWYRNVQAAGKCTLIWHSREYKVHNIEPVDMQTALDAFGQPFRTILRLNSTLHFVKMQYYV